MFNYKNISNAFTSMAQQMKANGECSLSSNSLLDRFAKGANFKSRQALKAALAQNTETQPQAKSTQDTEVLELHKEFAKYMADSYDNLFNDTHHFTTAIKEHGTDGYEIFIEEQGVSSFAHEETGLYGMEFSFTPSEEVSMHARTLSGSFFVGDLSSQRYETVDEMLASYVTFKVMNEFSMFEINVTALVVEKFIECGYVFTSEVKDFAEAELIKYIK